MSRAVTLTEAEKEKRHEDEFAFLQRQYRILEKDAVTFSNSSRSTLQTQELLIAKLREVKEDVMIQVTVAQNPTNTAIDNRVENDINTFLEKGSRIDRKIKRTRQYISEVDNEILKTQRELNRMSKSVLTEFDVQTQVRKRERRVGLYENRLQMANVKCNLILAENRRWAAKVERYVNDRTLFNQLHGKLIKKLTDGLKIMHDLIEFGLHKYDEREEAQVVLHSLEERSNQDTRVQTHAMTEFQRRHDHDTELKEYLAVKGQRRNMMDLEEKVKAKRAAKRVTTEKLIEEYSNILKEITDLSKETNIRKIVSMFTRKEEENFKLYKYATGNNRQVEIVQQQVDTLSNTIDDMRFTEKQRQKDREEGLPKLRNELFEKNAEADHARLEMESNDDELNDLYCGIEQLFWRVKADKTTILKLLGKKEQVDEHNYMRYFELIEKQTIKLRNDVTYLETITYSQDMPLETYLICTKPLRPFAPATVHQVVTVQPCAMCNEDKHLSNLEAPLQGVVLDVEGIKEKLERDKLLPEFDSRLHPLDQVCRREKTAMKRTLD